MNEISICKDIYLNIQNIIIISLNSIYDKQFPHYEQNVKDTIKIHFQKNEDVQKLIVSLYSLSIQMIDKIYDFIYNIGYIYNDFLLNIVANGLFTKNTLFNKNTCHSFHKFHQIIIDIFKIYFPEFIIKFVSTILIHSNIFDQSFIKDCTSYSKTRRLPICELYNSIKNSYKIISAC